MKVRASRAACRADFTDLGSALHILTRTHENAVHVSVAGLIPIAVIDLDEIAVAPDHSSPADMPIRSCVNRRASRLRKIHARMLFRATMERIGAHSKARGHLRVRCDRQDKSGDRQRDLRSTEILHRCPDVRKDRLACIQAL